MDRDCINKTMDRSDLELAECRAVLAELFGLMRRMQTRKARYSSWYGRPAPSWPSAWEHINRGEDYEPWPGNPDELHVPWFLLWEIAWLVVNTPLRPGGRVLDMGGAGSLFSCYLASRGHEVYAIDLQPELCDQAERTASIMGWRLKARQMDMVDTVDTPSSFSVHPSSFPVGLAFPDGHFDHVFSVCVFEHLPVSGRIRCNRQVARMLKPGGTASYTFDYANPQSFGQLDTPEDVRRQLIGPSGLGVRGNEVFQDTGKRYLEPPQCFGFGRFARFTARLHALMTGSIRPGRVLDGTTSYTFGSLFLEKRVADG
ncbi:MAG: class I SAM-dependent methyltransferase [Phycisphaerae bacterium]|nr:class I SAM-dependent methyltransferase [Phycisphaerae bacterium]